MADDVHSERLSLLKTEAGRSLRSFLRRTRFVSTRSRGGRNGQRAAAGTAGTMPIISPRDTGVSPEAVSVSVSLSGGPIFMDDERRLRAFAKEIKRLISEDRRRGLGVGG